MPSRFVILHHQLVNGEHWDLMLEHGDILLTWQLTREPVERSMLPMEVVRIADHRKLYLEYEGSISGDRGRVKRVDAGSVIFREITETCYQVTLSGGRLSGHLRLARHNHRWILEAPDQKP